MTTLSIIGLIFALLSLYALRIVNHSSIIILLLYSTTVIFIIIQSYNNYISEQSFLTLLPLIGFLMLLASEVISFILNKEKAKNVNNLFNMLNQMNLEENICTNSMLQYLNGIYSYDYMLKVINYLLHKEYFKIENNEFILLKKIPFNTKAFIYLGLIKKYKMYYYPINPKY